MSSSDGELTGSGSGTTDSNSQLWNVVRSIQSTLSNIPGALTNPERSASKWVIGIVSAWIVGSFIEPVFQAVLDATQAVVDSILFVAFGTDRVIGGPAYGIVDVPLAYVDLLQPGLTAVVVAPIEAFNQEVAGLMAQAGFAGPAVASLLFVVEVGVALWVAWSIIRVINVPAVDLASIIAVLTAPARWILEVLSG